MTASDTHSLKTGIVIPVYNHGATLREVVVRSLAVHPTVIVVDDGSRDQGLQTLEGLAVHLVRHPRNLGKGAAILSGAAMARRLGLTHVVTLDADSQHDPGDFDAFKKEIRADPEAIVIGVRDFETHYAPASSRVGRTISNFWFLVDTGHLLSDAQSGFRAYPIHVLESLKLKEQRYTFEIEVLVKAVWAGVPVREVPICVFYPPAEARISHFHRFRDNVRLSFLNARLFMRAVMPLPHRKLKRGEH
ncbi:MAG: glycosyltransferase family 2 protein [Desulfatiglandaceae bacterium]